MSAWIRPAAVVLAVLYFAAAAGVGTALQDEALAFVPAAIAGLAAALWAGIGLILAFLAAVGGPAFRREARPARQPLMWWFSSRVRTNIR